jgi:hypothetical protein
LVAEAADAVQARLQKPETGIELLARDRRYGRRMTRPLIDNQRARRLFLDRHLLLRPTSGPGSRPISTFMRRAASVD